MKKLILLLVLSAPTWAQIAFVGAPTPVSASSAATTSVTYTATLDNTAILFLGTSVSVTATSCSDNNSNPLIAGPTVGLAPFLQVFYYMVPSGATSFTCSWTNNAKSTIAVAEYSGVNMVNLTPVNGTSNQNNNTCTLNPISTVANDYMPTMCYVSVSKAWTVTSLTQRVALNSSANGSAVVMDNQSLSPGSGVNVTATTTGLGTFWAAIAVELEPLVSSTNMPPVVY